MQESEKAVTEVSILKLHHTCSTAPANTAEAFASVATYRATKAGASETKQRTKNTKCRYSTNTTSRKNHNHQETKTKTNRSAKKVYKVVNKRKKNERKRKK